MNLLPAGLALDELSPAFWISLGVAVAVCVALVAVYLATRP